MVFSLTVSYAACYLAANRSVICIETQLSEACEHILNHSEAMYTVHLQSLDAAALHTSISMLLVSCCSDLMQAMHCQDLTLMQYNVFYLSYTGMTNIRLYTIQYCTG